MRRRSHMRGTNPAVGPVARSTSASTPGGRRRPTQRQPASGSAGPIRPSRCVVSRNGTEPECRAGSRAAHVSCASKASPRNAPAATAPGGPVDSSPATTRSASPRDRRPDQVTGQLCDTPSLSLSYGPGADSDTGRSGRTVRRRPRSGARRSRGRRAASWRLRTWRCWIGPTTPATSATTVMCRCGAGRWR